LLGCAHVKEFQASGIVRKERRDKRPPNIANPALITALQNKATTLRIKSVRATTEAGSGHPSSCCSAAGIVATLFFSVMRYDPKNPKHPKNDRFILSKGHAAPLLYATWAEAGLFDKKELIKLRTLASDLEGHPTPRLPFVDVATGSLGQGLAAGVGMALNAKHLDQSSYRTYCWETANRWKALCGKQWNWRGITRSTISAPLWT
jgi:transketolase